jgi:GNAT superfamily N-acetyltransferase
LRTAIYALRDGTSVAVRAIEPSDAPGLVRFHEALSPDTQRSRFFAIHPHLNPLEVERFTTVDHHDRQALIALAGSEIVAVARYDRFGTTDAEVAFVTRDDHQGSGIATLLFNQLAAAARNVGVTRFVAQTLAENHSMLGVFTRTGLTTHRSLDRGIVEVTMELGVTGIGG